MSEFIRERWLLLLAALVMVVLVAVAAVGTSREDQEQEQGQEPPATMALPGSAQASASPSTSPSAQEETDASTGTDAGPNTGAAAEEDALDGSDATAPHAPDRDATSAPDTLAGDYPYGSVPSEGAVDIDLLAEPLADAEPVATAAITAFTSMSGLDAAATDWIDRLAPWVTPRLLTQVKRDYDTPEGESAFREMVATGTERRIRINYLAADGAMFTSNGARVTFVVDYTGSTRTAQDETWNTGTGSLSKFVNMTWTPEHGWRADRIVETSDRTAW